MSQPSVKIDKDCKSFSDWFAEQGIELKNNPVYELEGILLDITERISKEMKKQNISKKELSKRLGKKPSFMKKVLRGQTNLTLDDALRIGLKLGMMLTVDYDHIDDE